MRTALPRLLALAILVGTWDLACSVETTPQGTGGVGATGTGGAGGAECVSPVDCRGTASECRRRTCVAGRCGLEDEPQGTPTTSQIAGDCKRSVCDGEGNAVLVTDDTDVPSGGAQCSVGACAAGAPTSTPTAAGTACTANGGKVCDGAGNCLECLEAAQCAGAPCVDNHCPVTTCNDGMKDGDETGVDCGGPTCPKCPDGQTCAATTDCATGVCSAGVCLAPAGGSCTTSADCSTGLCSGGTCTSPSAVLLISQVKTHGVNAVSQSQGFGDDFVELYNPGTSPVILDSTWQVMHRSAQGGCQGTGSGDPRFVGAGQVLPAHAHFLIAGWGYMEQPAEDVAMLNSNASASLADAGSITLLHGGQVVDTICFYYDMTTLMDLTGGCTAPYTCAGTPVSNLPHDGSSQSSSAVDESLERLPGGALGNAQSTGDSNADFRHITPATPRDLASPPEP